MRRISGPTGWVVIGLLVAAVATAGTATAAKFFIPKGAVQPKHLSKKTKKKLRGNIGPQGPQGTAGPQGPAGPAGAAGTARAYGLVNNSSGSPQIQKAKGSPSVRRSGNGIFCIKAAGLDPSNAVLVAQLDASGSLAGFLTTATGSGAVVSSQCNGDEFQVLVYDANGGTGRNDVSFNFLIG